MARWYWPVYVQGAPTAIKCDRPDGSRLTVPGCRPIRPPTKMMLASGSDARYASGAPQTGDYHVYRVTRADPPPDWVERVPRSACWDEYTYLMLNGLAVVE